METYLKALDLWEVVEEDYDILPLSDNSMTQEQRRLMRQDDMVEGALPANHNTQTEEVTHGIDGSGLTAIVTGASSGIGAETSRVLALRGVHVIMAVRNIAAAEDVKETIVKEIPAAKVDIMELDLSSLASVRKFAADFISSGHSLNMLMSIRNSLYPFQRQHRAAICHKSSRYACSLCVCVSVRYLSCGAFLRCLGTGLTAWTLSAEYLLVGSGCEWVLRALLAFPSAGTGYRWGHFLLTNLLLDKMKETTRKTKREGRIVNVSSGAYRVFTYREGIRFDKINDPESYGRFTAYGQSKLANILHTCELTRRLKEGGVEITANSIHPGAVATNVFRNLGVFDGLVSTFGKFFFKTVQQGASTTCYVALHPQLKGISGEFFMGNNLATRTAIARDMDLAKRLWDFSMDLVK
ncbi:putative peroxidase 52-like [Capsicum annuum]|nr:putative peroxidase 52-like [Capsicum annuum]